MPPSSAKFDLESIRRRHSLSGLIGKRVKLRKSGAQRFKALCPFHAEKTPSFEVRDDQGTYHCYGCGAHGDLFRWVQETEGVDFVEAVRRLAEGDIPVTAAPIAQRDGPERRVAVEMVPSIEVARWLWRTADVARGSIVERYLASRRLQPDAMDGALLGALRFHPRAAVVPWRIGAVEGDVRRRAPAMLGLIRDAEGQAIGVHATYLRQDGSDKIERKMWGGLQRGAVWLNGRPDAPVRKRPIVAGEGIETVWAWAQQVDRAFDCAAALSLDNLQGGIVRPDGVWPLWNIRADLSRPPFVVRDASEAVILIDADMKPLKDQKLQRAKGERWERGEIDQLTRARICAAAAVQHWRAAGAQRVTAERPPAGMDFNDMVRSG